MNMLCLLALLLFVCLLSTYHHHPFALLYWPVLPNPKKAGFGGKQSEKASRSSSIFNLI